MIDILLYVGILILIEFVRVYIERLRARKSFGDYGDFFRKEKEKHPVTEEARAMEEEIANTHEGYAVRIENCSRLFFNTAGNPIPAVNCVSLGVKVGSLFGFLGANGAGKTTLIKMITSMLPCSDGKIEIHGRDIAEFNDRTQLSTCPQFNTHLCSELTPYEHFVLYSLLFQLKAEDAKFEIDRLINILELEDVQNKPIRELSSGEVRKLAIALSFLGPANIILLDEPTASLDPVARHHVHDMISSFKHEKTFMLCTHLLSEAETLCDNISIMIKGCVYTVGSPQYLSGKFGTEFKVDVMLNDDGEESARTCDQFFSKNLPTAVLSIARPNARIYTVPALSITLPQLFTIMEQGKQSSLGFNYYTCSSSSLERVFMEIVRMSELRDEGNDE
jgi:ABC-type multidrug transport system ATPase subunit